MANIKHLTKVGGGRRGTPSKTHPGRKNYTTKRGDKVFHRRHHNVRRRRRPYTHRVRRARRASGTRRRPRRRHPRRRRRGGSAAAVIRRAVVPGTLYYLQKHRQNRKTHHRGKKYRKGSPSKTRKGRLDFITHLGSNVYDRAGHFIKKATKPFRR